MDRQVRAGEGVNQDRLGKRETRERLVVRVDLRGLQDPVGQKAQRALREQEDLRASKAIRALPGRQDNRAQLV